MNFKTISPLSMISIEDHPCSEKMDAAKRRRDWESWENWKDLNEKRSDKFMVGDVTENQDLDINIYGEADEACTANKRPVKVMEIDIESGYQVKDSGLDAKDSCMDLKEGV